MSKEYDQYLTEHKENVVKAYQWLKDNLPDITEGVGSDERSMLGYHDESKYDVREYEAYDAYFYGDSKSPEVVKNFEYAWLTHIHENEHHWQHWVLLNDEPNEGIIALDMPYSCIIEMVCDWWSFSWKNGNLNEIFNWYDKRKNYMKLSDKTRAIVEDILDAMKEKLSE